MAVPFEIHSSYNYNIWCVHFTKGLVCFNHIILLVGEIKKQAGFRGSHPMLLCDSRNFASQFFLFIIFRTHLIDIGMDNIYLFS